MSIGLKELQEKYNKGSNYFRTLLCRPEFNQFRIDNNQKFFVMDDSNNFHKMLKFIINLKTKKYIILFLLLFNTQIALCQRYEPVIIYSPTGEPQTMIKGYLYKIINKLTGTTYVLLIDKKVVRLGDGLCIL